MANVFRLIYEGEFCDKAGDTILLQFHRYMSDATPAPTVIPIRFAGESAKPLTVSYQDDGDRKLQPIYGSGATVQIKAEGDFELSEMYTADEREWRLTVSGAENWQGWVIPDGCYEPYESKPYDVTVRCTDAIGTLKDVPFLKEDKTKYQGYVSDRDVIYDILKKTGLSLVIGHAVNTFEATMDNNFSPLAQCFPNTEGYLDTDGNPFSCYDVLKAILERWCCTLRQVDGIWQIVNQLEKSTGVVNMWRYGTANEVLSAVNIGNAVTVGGANRVFAPVNGTNGFAKGYASSMAYYKYGYPSNELFNGNFDDAFPPALPAGWVAVGGATGGSASVVDPVTNAATNNHYLIVNSGPNDDSFIVQETPIVVRAGEQVNVSFITRCDSLSGSVLVENRKLYMDLSIVTNDGWHFTEDSGWQNTPDSYRIIKRSREVSERDVTIQFSIPPRSVDYELTVGFRNWKYNSTNYPTKFENVQAGPTTDVKQTKPPVGVYYRLVQKTNQTFRPEPIVLLHSDDTNTIRNSRISISTPFPVQPPTTWSRWNYFDEDLALPHLVADTELRMHQRAYRIFEAEFVKVSPFDSARIDPNTLLTIDLLSGTYLMLSGTFDYKSGIHTLRLAEVLTDTPNYYVEMREDYGTEKDKEGLSIGTPSGVTMPPTSGEGTGAGYAYVRPEIIPFDWSVLPVTSIDMTTNGRSIFGNYPEVEIWLTIDDENESKLPGTYPIDKVLEDGMLTTLNFPDLDLELAPSQTGYFKISK